MPTEFKLPAVSEGVDSADVGDVHVSECDTIESGQIVLDVIDTVSSTQAAFGPILRGIACGPPIAI